MTLGSESKVKGKSQPKPRAGRAAWEQARQERTRLALVDAATTVFVRDGYAATTIAGITAEAGLSHGSFYNYFRTKEDILGAVVQRIHESFWKGTPSAAEPPPPHSDDPPRRKTEHTYDELYARLERSNRRFLSNYRQHASLLQLVEEVQRVDPSLAQMRRQLRASVVDKNTAFIATLQEEGLADPTVDAWHAANALGGMVDRFAHLWFVNGEPFDEETSVRMLTIFWLNALSISPKPHRRRATPGTSETARSAD